MISRADLASMARLLGFTLRQAEKDYIQHVVLHGMYAASISEFVFKGGTALQKVFGLDRFSEDLDFTCSVNNQDCVTLMEVAMRPLHEAEISKATTQDNSATVKVRVKGPLHDGRDVSVQVVKVECSTRENVLKPPRTARVVPRYRDLRPYVVLVMDEGELLAEKVRAVMTRNKARDIYDTWFLLEKHASCDLDMINAKLSYYKRSFTESSFHDAIHAKERSWEPEMKVLVKDVSPFTTIAPLVERGILDMIGLPGSTSNI